MENHKSLTAKEEEDQKTYQYYKDTVIPSLTVKKGSWLNDDIYHYRGFWFLPSKGLESALYMQQNFKPRSSDVLLATSPKCGTTWLKAIAFSVINRSRYTMDDTHPLVHTNPHRCVPSLVQMFRAPPIDDPDLLPSPRLLCSHFPYSLMPEPAKTLDQDGCSIVYLCRDPKDVLISLWQFLYNGKGSLFLPRHDDEGVQLELPSLELICDQFCDGTSPFGPFWDHALEYWKASLERPNKVLFLKYEDLKKDCSANVKRLAAFVGRPFTAEEEERGVLNDILKLCSFESLSNMEVNKKGIGKGGIKYASFFRKGEIGDWKNHLAPDMIDRIDRITREKFSTSGLIL